MKRFNRRVFPVFCASVAFFMVVVAVYNSLCCVDNNDVDVETCVDGWSTREGLAPYVALSSLRRSGIAPILADVFVNPTGQLHAVLITSHISRAWSLLAPEVAANWSCVFHSNTNSAELIVQASSRRVDPQAHSHAVVCSVPRARKLARTVSFRWGWTHKDDGVVELGPVPFCRMPTPRPEDKVDLAACTMIRGITAANLVEWIAWHRVQGFERFVFFANEDPAAVQQALAQYVAEGTVRIVDWSWPKRGYEWFEQVAQQISCIYRLRSSVRWLALHDVDEFLTPLSHGTIRGLVEEINSNATKTQTPPSSLRFHCRFFGGNGTTAATESLSIEKFTLAAPKAVRDRGKCIVRTTRVNYFLVHLVSSGAGQMLEVDPGREAFFAHFKKPTANCSRCTSHPVSEPLLLTRFAPQVKAEIKRISQQ